MSLTQLLKEGKLRLSAILGDYFDENFRKDYVICGENTTFSILLEFTGEEGATTDYFCSRVFGRLESYFVELESEDRSNGIGLHKMRSVESLVSGNSGGTITSQSNNEGLIMPLARNLARAVGKQKFVIPIQAIIDSEVSFEHANAYLKFQIFEERPDDTLRRFMREPRAGARLLRDLIADKDGEFGVSSLIVELLDTIELKIPIYRPLQASINYLKRSKDCALISVHLSCNKALQEVFCVEGLSMVLGDLESHTINHNSTTFDKQIFRVEAFSVQLPVEMHPGDVYGCIFEARIMPFANRRLRREPKEMKIRLDASINVCKGGSQASHLLQVSFETEVDLSRMFPPQHSEQLKLTLTLLGDPIYLNEPFYLRVLVSNETLIERDLIIRKPLEASSLRGQSNRRRDEKDFLTNEQMIDVYYSEYERYTNSFLPLEVETVIGPVPPGRCSSAHMNFLPVREGLHSIGKLVVIDRLSGQQFDLNQVLEIRVEARPA